MRWLTLPSGTAHAVHEVSTGWTQTERPGSLVFRCGRDGHESFAEPDNGRHCQSCARMAP